MDDRTEQCVQKRIRFEKDYTKKRSWETTTAFLSKRAKDGKNMLIIGKDSSIV